MSAPVDVLAVMDRAVDAMNDAPQVPPFMSDELYKARAAVAELIEADKEYDEAWRYMAGRTHTAARRERAGLRRAAALARVQGGAA